MSFQEPVQGNCQYLSQRPVLPSCCGNSTLVKDGWDLYSKGCFQNPYFACHFNPNEQKKDISTASGIQVPHSGGHHIHTWPYFKQRPKILDFQHPRSTLLHPRPTTPLFAGQQLRNADSHGQRSNYNFSQRKERQNRGRQQLAIQYIEQSRPGRGGLQEMARDQSLQ